MAMDWGKWQKDWAKLELKTKVYGLAQARKLMAIVTARDKLVEQHEKAFKAAIQAAIKSGIEGDTLKELSVYKPLVAAQSALDDDCRAVGTEIKTLTTFCKECDEVAKVVEKLSDDLARAMKSAKDVPAAITKLAAAIEVTRKDLHEAATFRFKVDKFLAAFPRQYPAWLKHITETEIEKGSGEAEKQREKAAAKAGIDLAGFEDDHDAVAALHGKLVKALDGAEAQIDTDLKKASAFLKTAQAELAKLKKLGAEIKAKRETHKAEIAAQKEAKKIGKLVDEIQDAVAEGQDQFKRMADQFKKAMAGR